MVMAGAAGLLTVDRTSQLAIEPIWTETVESKLNQIVGEWKARTQLQEAGLSPVRSVLLQGPPGVGKSLAASWLAISLDIPLATLNLAAVINSYLGKTGQNLAHVLDFAKRTTCVLFLDEFDALAKRRDDIQDVGELKRVVNVLLQAVDQWNAPSLLVAATNHPQLLDTAMFRRFDAVIDFPPVATNQAIRSLESLGVPKDLARRYGRDMAGKPLSEVNRRVSEARKHALLQGKSFRESLAIVWAKERASISPISARQRQVGELFDEGLSARAIAKELKVSHSTVIRDLKHLGKESNDGA